MRTATALLVLVLLGSLITAASTLAASSGGAGLTTSPTPGTKLTKVPVVPPLAPTLSPVSAVPQLSAGVAVRHVSRKGASAAAIAYLSHAKHPLQVRVDVVRRSDGLSVYASIRTVAPGVQQTIVWNGRATGGVALDGPYQFRISAGPNLAARSVNATPAPVPAGGATPGATIPATPVPAGSPPPPGAAVVGDFNFVGAIFPVRGKHGYGDAANSFGAGRDGHAHQGQDVLAKCGTPLVAAVGGVVRQRARQSAAGNYVVIDDPITKQSFLYAHLRQPAFVRHGMHVTAGQPIGIVGDTGDATTCHLHFELWTAPGWYSGGQPIDPLATLKHWDQTS